MFPKVVFPIYHDNVFTWIITQQQGRIVYVKFITHPLLYLIVFIWILYNKIVCISWPCIKSHVFTFTTAIGRVLCNDKVIWCICNFVFYILRACKLHHIMPLNKLKLLSGTRKKYIKNLRLRQTNQTTGPVILQGYCWLGSSSGRIFITRLVY